MTNVWQIHAGHLLPSKSTSGETLFCSVDTKDLVTTRWRFIMKAKRFTCHGERCSHSELVLCPLGEQLCPLRGQTSGFYQEPELYVRRSPQEGTSHSVVRHVNLTAGYSSPASCCIYCCCFEMKCTLFDLFRL